MAKPELGAKRQCQSCATKFYDMRRDPITCPKCGAIFHVATLARAPGRAEEEEAVGEKEGVDVVALDEVEAVESKVEPIEIDEEVEIEGAGEEDDTFLEAEEGEDDDVAGLIDGDLESDEET